MKTILQTILIGMLFMLNSCNTKVKQNASNSQIEKDVSAVDSQVFDAELLIDDTVEAHGGALYDKAHYRFTFRDKNYTFHNSENGYVYTVSSIKKKDTIIDVLENGKLTRTINGAVITLSEKDNAKYTEALNSVIYFATLPHKLKDKAVNKSFEGSAMVNEQQYERLGISFDQEGGGKDYDDKFMYWINSKTNTIEFLAYSYSTDGGGVRFRSAFNPRVVDGILFQDYINYKAPIGTPLKDLLGMYEKGGLQELSRILTEDVHSVM